MSVPGAQNVGVGVSLDLKALNEVRVFWDNSSCASALASVGARSTTN